jgi:hypothetical protein
VRFSSYGFPIYISPYRDLPKFLKSVFLVQLFIYLYSYFLVYN